MFECSSGVKFEKWLDGIGLCKGTGYNWVKKGMLKPTEILGNFFITREQDAEFWQRAKAGEFQISQP